VTRIAPSSLPSRTRQSDATFFTDRSKGELWVGPRLGVAATAARFGVEAQPIDDLPMFLNVTMGARPRVCCVASMPTR